ncbi:TPA: hypothetical protein ACGBXG_003748 [Klebsiella variicola]
MIDELEGRMALAAMDSSESVELPLDYLQGHKDGLEWAAQLAEANHPETGDWLYDDPIELAKAIRKGPDMPPAQPVADSDPVIIVGDDGGDALSYRRLIQSFEPGTKLYRHAQPVPVVSADLLHTAASAIEDLLTTKDRTGACVWFDLPFRLRSAANAQPAPVVPETAHSSVIAEQLAHVLSGLKVTDHQRAVISCAVDRLNNVAQLLQLSPSALLVPEILDYQGAKELYNYLMTEEETNATVNGWNACRAAMLAAAPQEVKGE